jgi:hypothetical protein
MNKLDGDVFAEEDVDAVQAFCNEVRARDKGPSLIMLVITTLRLR